MSERNPVAKPIAQWGAMSKNWDLVNTLWGGTDAMRDAGKLYLPQMPDEPESAYFNRLASSVLTNVYKDTIEKLVSKPLKQPVVLGDDVPEDIANFRDTIDGQGTDIDVFTKKIGEAAMNHGVTYILVDYPQAAPDATLAEQKIEFIRPYAIHYQAPMIIGWKSEVVNGKRVLRQVRIFEKTYRDVGEFEQQLVEQIRVLEPGFYRTYTKVADKDNNEDWMLTDSYEVMVGNVPLDFIPLIPIYSAQTGFMTAEPSMIDVAHLNVTHWQSDSDQRNILHIARVPILFGAGLGDETQAMNKLSVGATTFIKGDLSSDLKYVEHSGAGIEAGRQDLLDLEERMSMLGLNMLVKGRKTGGNVTATARGLDQAEADSPLSMFARELENGLEKMLDYFGVFMGKGPDTGGSVSLFKDFSLTQRDSEDIKELGMMRARGDISQLTYWEELKRRNLLSDDFDAEVEIDLLDLENPARMGLTEQELEKANRVGDETGSAEGHTHILQNDGLTNSVDGHKHRWEPTGTQTSVADGHSHSLSGSGTIETESQVAQPEGMTNGNSNSSTGQQQEGGEGSA